MMYGSWDTEWDRQNFLSFWVIFCPFNTPPLNDPKNQIFEEKKWKKCWMVLSFYTCMCNINEDHMIYGSWNIRCHRQKSLSWWAIFCPFSPLHTHLKQLFMGHLYDACAKTSDIVVIKIITSTWYWNQNTLFDLLFAVIVQNWVGSLLLPWVCRTCN